MNEKLLEKDILSQYTTKDIALLSNCVICPRRCKVNRVNGEFGYCKVGLNPILSSYNIHYGEEPPISGYNGSGTIFFTHCNMRCIYCQNYPISQLGVGKEMTIEQLADIMIELQSRGAHNINFVTPSHMTIQIIRSVTIARDKGLTIPIVYNTSGYDSLTQLKMLKGIVDIYLADMRYNDSNISLGYSDADDYPEINRKAITEMYNQVGDLVMDDNGIGIKGLIIRHLILPDDLSGSKGIFDFIGSTISKETYISLMSQYFPAFESNKDDKINRRITRKKYATAKSVMFKSELYNGWFQEME